MAGLATNRIQWVTLVDGETLQIVASDGDRGNYQRFTATDQRFRDGAAVSIIGPTTVNLAYDGTYDAILFIPTSGSFVWATNTGSGGTVAAPPASSTTRGIVKLTNALGGSADAPTVFGFASTAAFQSYVAAQIAAGGGSGGGGGTITAVDGGSPSSNFSGTSGIDGGSP